MGRVASQEFPHRQQWLAGTASALAYLTNRDDAGAAFRAFACLCGPQMEAAFQRYARSLQGQRRMAEPCGLTALLRDEDALRGFAPNTLGGAYHRFAQANGLGADSLLSLEEAAHSPLLSLEPNRRRFLKNFLQLHDIYHLLLGYGRERLGEACVLAFTASHVNLPPIGHFAHLVALKEPKAGPALQEAERIGEEAVWTLDRDWAVLLGEDLACVRRALRIRAPFTYLDIASRSDADGGPEPTLLTAYAG